MKILAASLVSILTVLLLYLTIVLVPLFIAGAPIPWDLILFVSFWVFTVAAIVIAFIGIPAYNLLNRLGKLTKINLAIVGFIVPAVLVTLMDIFFTSDGYSARQNYYGTYRSMIIDGERTIWGWLRFLEEVIMFGMLGAVAAVIFGLIANHFNSKAEQI